jgi:PAS domain S-box-containing protein
MDLSGYKLEALHQDGELVLYRGTHPHPADGAPSSVLVVGPAGEYASPATLARLEHEYSLAGELDPRWAVRPIALVRHRGHPMLVLDDPGGQPLDRQLGTPMEMGPFLRLAIGLAGAVASLHRAGLIHKDIKPTSVLAASTGEVRLTSFGIASRMRRERVAAAPPEVIAGTLAYMAPEQTGRMNRSIDSRSDLYALGVTLYEMVTGTLPFTASDPMEWVHCHMARRPVLPSERVKELPTSVSALIMKLLAKTAEERYQTAAGLERDLQRCLVQWEAERRIDAFPLGEHDTPDRLLIHEKLYGRGREIEVLLAAFDQVVKDGAPELVLVSGYSGIGKSAVVNELHKALVPPRGLFAAGKFDQYKRDIPYATLAQAFQSLIQHLLGKSEAELGSWRAALREAVEPNGRLMADLVPELTLLIGDQPPVPELAPQDAQRRFQLVFRRFLGVFARPDHPLALFLDDLQWLDAATLDMLEDLFTQGDVRSLLVIGAYRDNEVSAIHPLRRTLETIRHAGASVQEISLAPLARLDVGQLIADALHCEPPRVTPLAQLVHDKTAGNPFFAIQFIAALAEEGLLAFDHGWRRWSWDLDRIHAKGYTENVVDLMVGKLHRLPIDTQEALQQLACLGHSAAITTLALVYGTSEEEVHARLWEAVRNEVIERVEGAYAFIHDRVQEAAYYLIPEEEHAAAHLRIGRLLAAHTPPERREEAIFELVNQLNRGAALITEQEERDRLAELNLIAGTRAKNSTAYNSALTYLLAGAAFLAGDCWEHQHALTFSLELHRAECEFVTGALAAAEERLTALSMRAATAVEHATVACLRMDVYTTLGQSGRAIAVGLDYLRRVGIDWSPHPTEEDVRREYERIWAQLGGRTVEELIELPLMSDVASLAILDVLTQLAPPAWHTDANLLSLVVCRAVNLSLEGGNCDGSCYAYVLLGAIAGPRFGDYQAGLRFGQLGYDLVEQRGLKRFQAEVYLTLNLVLPWTRHVRICRDLVRRAFEAANKIGDLTCASYCSNQLNANLLATGNPLAETQRVAEDGLAFAQKMRFGHSIDVVSTQLGLIRTLRGLTPKFGSLDDERFDERRIERRFADNPDLVVAESRYWIRKLQARYLAGDFAAAAEAASQAERLLWISQTPLDAAECHLYCALSHAAVCDSATADERQQHVEALIAHHRQLAVWAQNGPENFEHRAALVGAEIARLEGRELDAMRLYERAIQSARANGFVHHEALAHELAGRFFLQGGFETAGSAHLRHSRACYALWGADAKARQLDELYPHLTQAEPPPDARRTIGAPIEHLELATVLNVLRAVSGELVLDTLVETLLRTALEHAGADRGLLIVPRDDDLSIQAEAATSGSAVRVRLCETPVSEAALPASVVRYAARTRESVILDDASARTPFSDDEYIGHQHARSVLCLPLVKQGTLVAVLYLENTLAPGVFTPGRVAVLQLLASQAATSLDNSRLYRELQEREARIRQLVDANIIGVVITELDGPIVEANDAFLAMLGYSRDDLVSGRLAKAALIPAEWHATVQRTVTQIRATGRYETHEIEFVRRDGSRVAALVGGAALEDTRTKAVSFVLDLTERKRSEEALQRAHTELAHVTRVTTLGELAASIAHEVNQPLAAIVADANASLNWLAKARPDLDRVREALDAIVRDGHRAGEVIQRIRQLARKAPPRKDAVDLNEVVRDVVAVVRSELRRQGISLMLNLASKLAPVLGDQIHLQQVLLNLVMNGLEAMASVTDRPRELIIQSEPHDNDHVRVAVHDTGIGIAANDLDHVFSAFFTTKPDGMGMGLSISRSIVVAHGGRLWATPNRPHGAILNVALPVATYPTKVG